MFFQRHHWFCHRLLFFDWLNLVGNGKQWFGKSDATKNAQILLVAKRKLATKVRKRPSVRSLPSKTVPHRKHNIIF